MWTNKDLKFSWYVEPCSSDVPDDGDWTLAGSCHPLSLHFDSICRWLCVKLSFRRLIGSWYEGRHIAVLNSSYKFKPFCVRLKGLVTCSCPDQWRNANNSLQQTLYQYSSVGSKCFAIALPKKKKSPGSLQLCCLLYQYGPCWFSVSLREDQFEMGSTHRLRRLYPCLPRHRIQCFLWQRLL